MMKTHVHSLNKLDYLIECTACGFTRYRSAYLCASVFDVQIFQDVNLDHLFVHPTKK